MTTMLLTTERREGSANVKYSDDGLILSETYNFLVESDTKTTTRQEVLFNTPGLPVVGILYASLGLRCTGMDAKRRSDNAYYWDVSATFDSKSERQKQDPNNPSADPTTWIPVFVIDGFETRDVVLTEDLTPATVTRPGASSPGPYKCTNSVGQPFSEPITKKRTCCSFSFDQFEDASTSINELLDRNYTTNETSFAGRPERTLLLMVTKAELGTWGGHAAWKVSYRCVYDRDTWDEKRLDKGTLFNNGTDLEPYLDPATNSTVIVGDLDGDGGKSSTPFELEFRCVLELEFNDFIRT